MFNKNFNLSIDIDLLAFLKLSTKLQFLFKLNVQ